MSGKTPGQAACEAYDLALYGDSRDPDIWLEDCDDRARAAWEAAAQAAIAAAGPTIVTCDHSPAELGITINGEPAPRSITGAGTEHLAAELAERGEGASDVRPREGERGWYDVTCGKCGDKFGTNFDLDEIECAECEARRCPQCRTWFGGD